MKKQRLKNWGLAGLITLAPAGCGPMIAGIGADRNHFPTQLFGEALTQLEAAELSRDQININVQHVNYQGPSASINEITVKPGIDSNDVRGLIVNGKIFVSNCAGERIRLIAYLYDSEGNKLIDRDGINRADDGQASVSGPILVPPYVNTSYNDATFFIPYENTLDIPNSPGWRQYKMSVSLFHERSGTFLAGTPIRDLKINLK